MSTPGSVASVKDDAVVVPPKKIKFNAENNENIDPQGASHSHEKLYKPLTILGESNMKRSRTKPRYRTRSQGGSRRFEIDNSQEIVLDPFVERLPSTSIRIDRAADQDVINYSTPPGIPCILEYHRLSVDSPDVQLQNQDETAICDTVYRFFNFVILCRFVVLWYRFCVVS